METIHSLIYHTKTEKRSFFLLIVFIVCLSLGNRFLLSNHKPVIEDICYLEEYLQPNQEELIKQESVDKLLPVRGSKEIKKKLPSRKNEKIRSSFSGVINPNTASEDSLKLLGISNFAVSNLLKYREKGGIIERPGQLTKIYGIDSSTFTKIKDHISIPKAVNSSLPTKEETRLKKAEGSDTVSFAKAESPEKRILIDINTADEVQLQYVKGIGPSFAKRIVKYRELVGGYHSKKQLQEVYGLDRKKYMEIKDQITLGGKINTIDVNSSDYKVLANHPYINYQEARLIVAYTAKHGPLKNAYDIVKIGVMDSLFVEKILPYLPESIKDQKAHVPPTSL